MDSSLSSAFDMQKRIVHALILQDMSTRYSRTKLGAINALFEPVAVVVAMYVIRYYIQGVSSVNGIPMIMFVVTGFLPDFCFRIVAGSVIAAAERKASSRMFPQVTSFDVIIAKAISSSVISAGAMLSAFVIACIMTGSLPSNLLICLYAALLVFALGFPSGLILGILLRRYPTFRVLVGSILRINFVMSGAAFLGTEVPKKMLPYVSWNPTFHCVELMREGWFRGYVSPIADPGFVLECILALAAIGIPLERLTRKGQIT